jgi:SAM-dependent methyltransferase
VNSGPSFPHDDLEADAAYADVARLVGDRKRVLSLGPARSHLSRVLRDRGCVVTGIELDPGATEAARKHLDRVIVGDLEALELASEHTGERFDVIVATDVLAHLWDPLRVLRELRQFLDDGGYLVATVPDLAHIAVRLASTEDSSRSPYSETRPLHSSHLPTSTRQSLDGLIDAAGFVIRDVIRQPIDATEAPFHSDAVPAGVGAALEADPDATTYQFVFSAFPVDDPVIATVAESVRALAFDTASLADGPDEVGHLADNRGHVLASIEERLQEVERVVAGLAAREGDLRERFIDAQDQLIQRDQVLAEAHAHAEALEREARELRVRLERIHSLKLFALYRSLRGLPVLRTLEARRVAGVEKALRRSAG